MVARLHGTAVIWQHLASVHTTRGSCCAPAQLRLGDSLWCAGRGDWGELMASSSKWSDMVNNGGAAVW